MRSFTSLALETHFLRKLKTQSEHEVSATQLFAYVKGFYLKDIVEIYWGLKNINLYLKIGLTFKEGEDSEEVKQSATYSTSENSSGDENFQLCELSGDFTTIPERRILPYFNVGSIMRMEAPVLDESVAEITRQNMLSEAMFNIPVYFAADCMGNVNINVFAEESGYQYPYGIEFFGRNLELFVNTFEPPSKLKYDINFSLEPESYSPEDFGD